MVLRSEMNIKKSLLTFDIGVLSILTSLIIYSLSSLVEGINFSLLFFDIYVFINVIVILFVALLLPDMKYSYKTKNILGILLIIGIMLQGIFWYAGLKTGIKFGRFIVNIVVLMSLIGVFIALKDA